MPGASSRGRRGADVPGHADLSGHPDAEVQDSPHQLLLKKLAAAKAEHGRDDHPAGGQAIGGRGRVAPANADTPAEQLAKLAALNSEGILDNEEYLAAKAKVMAKLKRDRAAADKAAADKPGRKSGAAGPSAPRNEQTAVAARQRSAAQEQQPLAEDHAAAAATRRGAGPESERHEHVAAGETVAAAAGKHPASGADATADGTAYKAKRRKLVGQDRDDDEASILDPYHEYTDEGDQQSNAPPGQQGGEKLQPQSKSFFSDVRREAHKVDANENLPADMLEAMDLNVEPCDDFYEYACGTFLKEAVIPDYLTAYTLTWDRAKTQVISEVQDLLVKDAGEAGAFYRSCLDEKAVDAAGATPLTAWFQAIAGVTDMDSMSSFLATAGKYNWCGFFCWHVSLNSAVADANKFVVSHVATTMPDRKYYVDEGEDMERHRAALLQAMEDLLLAAGAPSRAEATRQAQVCVCVCLSVWVSVCVWVWVWVWVWVCVSVCHVYTQVYPTQMSYHQMLLCLVYTHPTPLPSRTQMSYDEMLREHERLRSVVEAIATSEKAKAALLKVLRHAIVTRALLPYK